MAVSQAYEASEIAVGRDKLTSVLDRERRVIGIRDELAPCSCFAAQTRKHVPARGAVREEARIRSLP
jgi:hypothetical protein